MWRSIATSDFADLNLGVYIAHKSPHYTDLGTFKFHGFDLDDTLEALLTILNPLEYRSSVWLVDRRQHCHVYIAPTNSHERTSKPTERLPLSELLG